MSILITVDYNMMGIIEYPQIFLMKKPILYVITPVSRHENLGKVAKSLQQVTEYFELRWLPIMDELGGDLGGGRKRNLALDRITDLGWVFLLDDDTIVHPNLAPELYKLIQSNHDSKMFVFYQVEADGSLRAGVNNRMAETYSIDSGQAILRSDIIRNIKQAENIWISDGMFFEKIVKQRNIVPIYSEIIGSYYNYLRPAEKKKTTLLRKTLDFIENKRGSKQLLYAFLVFIKDIGWRFLGDTSFSFNYKVFFYSKLYKITHNPTYAEKFINGSGRYAIFYYDGSRIIVEKNSEHFSRGKSSLKILEKVIERNREYFRNKRGIISFDDFPLSHIAYSAFDIAFCGTIDRRYKTIAKPFPCPFFDSWPEVGVDSSKELFSYFFDHKDDPYQIGKAFWIWSSSDSYVSIKDHARYKYLIDCPGWGGHYSGRLKWLIATGRPVFIVDRQIVEPWQKNLLPFVHYIPVRADLSDLLDRYHYMEKHPELYDSIHNNAIAFAKEYFSEAGLMRMVEEGLEKAIDYPKNPKIRLYSFSSPETKELEKLFRESIKDDWEVTIDHFESTAIGNGFFNDRKWHDSIRYKAARVLDYIKSNIGDIIVISDIDVVFLKPCKKKILELIEGKDVIFQSEHFPTSGAINGGFVAIRCNEKTLKFWENINKCDFSRFYYADQDIINTLLPISGLKWGLLPNEFYNRSHSIAPPVNKMFIFHATLTIHGDTIKEKIKLINEINKKAYGKR